MQRREWTTVDKSEWGNGPWEQEPDKRQWVDPTTGYPCLMVRNHSGAWCGYVGIDQTHPLHGADYGAKVTAPGLTDKMMDRPIGNAGINPMFLQAFSEEKEAVSVDCLLNVHGGITFGDSCQTHTKNDFKHARSRLRRMKKKARGFPVGDYARWHAEWRPILTKGYRAYVEKKTATGICHVPDPGEPETLWWLGFDTVHAGDYAPGMAAISRRLGFTREWEDAYRDLSYVETETQNLASQLKEIAEWLAESKSNTLNVSLRKKEPIGKVLNRLKTATTALCSTSGLPAPPTS